jgi:hypothetical protein
MLNDFNKQRLIDASKPAFELAAAEGRDPIIRPTKVIDAIVTLCEMTGVQDEMNNRNLIDNRKEAERMLAGIFGLV